MTMPIRFMRAPLNTVSWWMTAPRDHFTELAWSHVDRMQASPEANKAHPMVIGQMKQATPRMRTRES